MARIDYPTIPKNITVHLGEPNEAAENVTVSFRDYIKNVASSELYANWPIDALKANILAQINFALNRVYNEWYRSSGYNFDITSLPSYDQTYVKDREVYEKISQLVDELFNTYFTKGEQVQPLFASYCDGKEIKCDGLSQWGSVELANQGKDFKEILMYYYGDDINFVFNAPLEDRTESYPGYEIKEGIAGDMVLELKRELNRISQNYPAIPVIEEEDIFFTPDLEEAIKVFQEVFNLNVTGVVDSATWYKIKYVYNSVKKISDIYGEGISAEEATKKYPTQLKYGDVGSYINPLAYYLQAIAYFDPSIPYLDVSDNVFDENLRTMVIAFQKENNLNPNGIVNVDTWIKLKEVYNDIVDKLPLRYRQYEDLFFPGRYLLKGMMGEDVIRLQTLLYQICVKTKSIPGVVINGMFDDLTQSSIKDLQKRFGYEETGVVNPSTWKSIVDLSRE